MSCEFIKPIKNLFSTAAQIFTPHKGFTNEQLLSHAQTLSSTQAAIFLADKVLSRISLLNPNEQIPELEDAVAAHLEKVPESSLQAAVKRHAEGAPYIERDLTAYFKDIRELSAMEKQEKTERLIHTFKAIQTAKGNSPSKESTRQQQVIVQTPTTQEPQPGAGGRERAFAL